MHIIEEGREGSSYTDYAANYSPFHKLEASSPTTCDDFSIQARIW